MGDHHVFKIEFDGLDAIIIGKAIEWVNENRADKEGDKTTTFVLGDKKINYPFRALGPRIFNPDKGESEGPEIILIDKILGSNLWLSFGFLLPITDNESNMTLLEGLETGGWKKDTPGYKQVKTEFDDWLKDLRKRKKDNKLELGYFELNIRKNQIEFDAATGDLSMFFCACDETIAFVKDFCKKLKPKFAGIEYIDRQYYNVLVNKSHIISICAWNEKTASTPDIPRIMSSSVLKNSQCLYWFRRGDIKKLGNILETHSEYFSKDITEKLQTLFTEREDFDELMNDKKRMEQFLDSPIDKDMGMRLHSLFKEDADINEFILDKEETEELLEIFSVISLNYSKRRPDFQKILSRHDHELVGACYEVREFLNEVLKQGFTVKIVKSENREIEQTC